MRHRPLLSAIAVGAMASGVLWAPLAAAAPSAPTFIEVTVASTTSVTLAYDAVPGATSYAYSLNGGSPVSMATTRPFTVTGLTTGAIACFEITATGAAGTSGPSQTRCAVPNSTTTPASAKPVITSVTTTSDSATVTYTRADDGFAATEFQVWLDGSYFGSVYDFASPMTITGLAPGTPYSLQIKPQGIGTAPDTTKSDPYAIRTLPASSSEPDLALVYPTATLQPNGGSCEGVLVFTRAHGRNGTFDLPTACSREGYSLAGWARTPTSELPEFGSGWTVPIGDESFTLWAVWVPDGIAITYAANVADADACVGSARQLTVVSQPGDALASQAPCTPPGFALTGWRVVDSRTIRPSLPVGSPVRALGVPRGGSVVLAAQWSMVYEVSISSASSIASGSTADVTVTASRNGQPAPSVLLALRLEGALTFTDFGLPVRVVFADAGGVARFTVKAGAVGRAIIRAAVGNVAREAQVEIVAASRSIVIQGQRTSVAGKPAIRIDGATVGFASGSTVTPYFRFPGETTFSQGTARPVIGEDGEFRWERKTGKKLYAYLTSADGTVRSNTIIIPAN